MNSNMVGGVENPEKHKIGGQNPDSTKIGG